MYILSLDLGSTNTKAIILQIVDKPQNEKEIKLIGKVREKNVDFSLFVSNVIKKYNIDKKDIKLIIATGTGSSFIDDSYENIEIIKIDEFNAIAYGGLILSKLDEAIIVSIGTGTTILYTDLEHIERLGGTGLGGGTFVGLSNAILQNKLANKNLKTFRELVDMAKNGKRQNVDLTIGDISKSIIGNMDFSITAANFAGTNKIFNEDDLIAGVANLIIENIFLLVKSYAKNYKVVCIGTFVTDDYIKSRILELSHYTNKEVVFVDDAEYAIAIGAWEYFLLKINNNQYI